MAGVAALCWALTEALAPIVFAFLGILITIVRIFIVNRRRSQWRSWYDLAFSVTTVAYLFCSGALTFWAYTYYEHPAILTMTLIVSLVNTMSIAFRMFAEERFIKLNIIAIVAPVTLAFLMRGSYFYAAALTQVVLAWHVYKSAGRLRNILLSEMNYRRRSDTVATRFRFAIDNMSHGMCMIDSKMRIVVSNAELAETFGVPGTRSLQGTKFSALVRLARQRGTLSHADADRLLASFDVTRALDSVARLEAPGPNGRVYDLTLKRNEEGGWVLVVQDVTDQRRAREALDMAARFDAMTNLPNRRSFEERLTEELSAARGRDARTEVLFIDLDGFKQINDTLGHKFGDRVLAESARRLREATGGAYVSRWGGDEFVVLRSGTDDESLDARRAVAHRRTVAADLDRGRRGGGGRERRRRHLRRRRHQHGRAAAAGRHGPLFRQARSPRHLPPLRAFDERKGARAPAARTRSSGRARRPHLRIALPADRRHRDRRTRQLRGAGALAPSRARRGVAGRVRARARRSQPHERLRLLGAAAGLRGRGEMAAAGQGRRQRLHAPDRDAGGRRAPGAQRLRPRSRPPGAGDHRDRRARDRRHRAAARWRRCGRWACASRSTISAPAIRA